MLPLVPQVQFFWKRQTLGHEKAFYHFENFYYCEEVDLLHILMILLSAKLTELTLF